MHNRALFKRPDHCSVCTPDWFSLLPHRKHFDGTTNNSAHVWSIIGGPGQPTEKEKEKEEEKKEKEEKYLGSREESKESPSPQHPRHPHHGNPHAHSNHAIHHVEPKSTRPSTAPTCACRHDPRPIPVVLSSHIAPPVEKPSEIPKWGPHYNYSYTSHRDYWSQVRTKKTPSNVAASIERTQEKQQLDREKVSEDVLDKITKEEVTRYLEQKKLQKEERKRQKELLALLAQQQASLDEKKNKVPTPENAKSKPRPQVTHHFLVVDNTGLHRKLYGKDTDPLMLSKRGTLSPSTKTTSTSTSTSTSTNTPASTRTTTTTSTSTTTGTSHRDEIIQTEGNGSIAEPKTVGTNTVVEKKDQAINVNVPVSMGIKKMSTPRTVVTTTTKKTSRPGSATVVTRKTRATATPPAPIRQVVFRTKDSVIS